MRSLRSRIATTALLGQLVLLALGTVLAYRAGTEVLERQFDETLVAKAAAFRALLEQQGEDVEFDVAAKFMPEYEREEDPQYFHLWLEGTNLVQRSPSLGMRDFERRVGSLEEPASWNDPLPDGRRGRYVGVRMSVMEVEADEETGIMPTPAQVSLVMAKDRAGLDRLSALLLAALLAGDLLLVACGAVLVWWAVGHSLGPIYVLAEHVEAVDVETLATHFDVDEYPRELRPIVAGLDDLLRRLDGALRAERRTASNVAHELRTPISELRALTEIGMQPASDDAYRAHVVRQAHEIAIQMNSLISMVRQLTHLDAHQGVLEPQEVPIAALFEHLLLASRDRIEAKGLIVDVDVNGAVFDCNRDALTSVCGNLVGNAIEYAPAGTRIEVRAPVRDGVVALRIANECVGLTPAHLPHLTEPFWRLSASRTDASHHGLGLTIARGMAALAGVELSFGIDRDRFVAEASGPGSHGGAREPRASA